MVVPGAIQDATKTRLNEDYEIEEYFDKGKRRVGAMIDRSIENTKNLTQVKIKG